MKQNKIQSFNLKTAMMWLLAVALFPFAFTYLVAKEEGIKIGRKVFYIAGLWVFLFILLVMNSGDKAGEISKVASTPDQVVEATNDSGKQKVESSPQVTEQPKKESDPEQKQESSLSRIMAITKDKTSVDATVFNGDNLAKEGDTPYEVMINFPFSHSISSCDAAKRVSHEVLKTLYEDSNVRKDLDRVLVTIPYYLKVSLGASDGVPMAEKRTFNGPTLFWNTLVSATGSEDESGELRDRTWGILLDRCE